MKSSEVLQKLTQKTHSVPDREWGIVYALKQNKEIVYIGQALSLFHAHVRLVEHMRGKKFNGYSMAHVRVSDLLRVERELILQLQPIYNLHMNASAAGWKNKIRELIWARLHPQFTFKSVVSKINEEYPDHGLSLMQIELIFDVLQRRERLYRRVDGSEELWRKVAC